MIKPFTTTWKRTKPKPQCQICYKIGYTVTPCFYRFDQEFQALTYTTNNQSMTAIQSLLKWWVTLIGFQTLELQTIAHQQLATSQKKSTHDGPNQVYMGNGEGESISHIGESFLHSSTSLCILHLKNVVHIPHLTKNLIGVSKFAQDNKVFFEFLLNACFVKDQVTGAILLLGTLEGGLCVFHVWPSTTSSQHPELSTLVNSIFNKSKYTTIPSHSSIQALSSIALDISSQLNVWHQQLGHPSLSILKRVLNACNISYSKNKRALLCTTCQLGKQHKLPFQSSYTIYKHLLELVHVNIWSPCLSSGGFRYYIFFTGHAT